MPIALTRWQYFTASTIRANCVIEEGSKLISMHFANQNVELCGEAGEVLHKVSPRLRIMPVNEPMRWGTQQNSAIDIVWILGRCRQEMKEVSNDLGIFNIVMSVAESFGIFDFDVNSVFTSRFRAQHNIGAHSPNHILHEVPRGVPSRIVVNMFKLKL